MCKNKRRDSMWCKTSGTNFKQNLRCNMTHRKIYSFCLKVALVLVKLTETLGFKKCLQRHWMAPV